MYNLYLALTLNDLIRISFEGPGQQLPASMSPLFKRWALPDDKEHPFIRRSFFNELVRQCGQFEVSPHDYLQFALEVEEWTNTRLRYWQRTYDVLNAEYEPLHNYDRTEHTHDVTKEDGTVKSVADSNTAGFDSGQLVADSQTKGDGEDHRTTDFTHNTRNYGNIGVTTSQQMLQQEIEVAALSMQKIIIDEFKQEFCILVY